MINWIKKYWAELLVFGIISAVLFICQAPDMTWIDTNSDGVHLTYAAKYLYPAHKGSAPLYLLWQHLMLWIVPFGSEYWKMALSSVIPTIVSAVLIYVIVKGLTISKNAKWIALVASIVYGSSAIIISQAIIVKYYPMVVMLGLGAYWFALKEKWSRVALCLGASMAIHPIAVFFVLPIIVAYKQLRNWKKLLIMASFALFYLYIPITNRPPYMWEASNSSAGIFGWVNDTLATAQMLSGGLAIWDFPKRVIDTMLQLGLDWELGIIPLAVFVFWKSKWYKNVICWIMLLSIGYYAIDLAPQTYVYMLPAIAFGCIGIGIGLSKMNKYWIWAVAIVGIVMMGYNASYFDIGRTLDPNLSAKEFYTKELPKVPDSEILIAQQGWEWAMVYPYNANQHKNVIPVNPGSFASPKYQEILHSWGIKFDSPNETNLVVLQNDILQSILANNSNVWITVPTHPETYGAEIIPYKGNEDKIGLGVPQSITDGSRDMKWNWRPSNPYDIITGKIEVTQWVYITFSNYNMLMFLMLGTMGAVPVLILWKAGINKKKWKFSNVVQNLKREVVT